MQCSNNARIKPAHILAVCRYDTSIERREKKRALHRKERRVNPDVVYISIHDNFTEAECTVRKPRLPWHAVGCDCVICERL